MAKRKTGALEDLFGIAAALPWWMGIAIAAIAYSVFYHYTAIEMLTSAVPEQSDHVVVEQRERIFVYYGQYILPLLFLAGALASFFKQHKRRKFTRTLDNGKPGEVLLESPRVYRRLYFLRG